MKLSPNLPLSYVLFFQKDVFIRKEELQRKREGETGRDRDLYSPNGQNTWRWASARSGASSGGSHVGAAARALEPSSDCFPQEHKEVDLKWSSQYLNQGPYGMSVLQTTS